MSAFFQLTLDMFDNFTVERIERTYASEVIIVLTHHFKPFARNSSTTGNVLQKRNDLLVSFRATERKDEEGVEVLGILLCVSHALNNTNQKLEIREGARRRE